MKFKLLTLLAPLIAVVLLLPADSFAAQKKKKVVVQPKKKTVVVSRHKAKPNLLVKLPTGHKKVVVSGKNYYFHAGAWYNHSPSGYKLITAPIGARIKVLPAGYTVVVHSGIRYYHYYGAYYLYDADSREYCVVDKPIESTSADIITLIDGEIMYGRYMGGDDDSVEFLVEDDLYEIAVEDIVSILFEPPSDH